MRAEDASGADRRPPELDDALLVRCRSQDPVAFHAFVVRYERAVFALLSQMLGRGPHVEDLAQETFLRAYVAFPRFEVAGGRASAWLLTIAARLALNARRRKNPAPGVAPELADPMTPELESARRELAHAIERAIGELSADHRAVFVLCELQDLSLAEIAGALELPLGTVKTRLFRAREQLRKRLEGVRKRGRSGTV